MPTADVSAHHLHHHDLEPPQPATQGPWSPDTTGQAGDWELPGSGYTRRHSAPCSRHTESLGLKAAGFWGLQARVPSRPCLLRDSASSPLGRREHGAGFSCLTYPALQLYSAWLGKHTNQTRPGLFDCALALTFRFRERRNSKLGFHGSELVELVCWVGSRESQEM